MASSSSSSGSRYTEQTPLKYATKSSNGSEHAASTKPAQPPAIDEDPALINAPEDYQYPTGAKFWLLMFNLAAVIMLGAIDMSIVSTAVPRITDHFHTVADVGWYSIAFRLTQCAFQFLYGKAYKLFPVKQVFLVANGFSFLGSILCATAVSSPMLVVGRAVAGIGTAGLDAGAALMLVQSTPLRIRPIFKGMWGAIEGVSTIAGPLLGGALTQTIGWRWCFWISVPIGGATLLLTLLCFSEKTKDSDVTALTFREKLLQLDVISNILLVPALICLFVALSWGGTKYAWSDSRILVFIFAFAVLTAGFIHNQIRKGDAAALPIRVIMHRTVIASVLFTMLSNSAGNVLEYYLPIYFQAVRGYSPAESGYLMIPILVVATLGAIGAGLGMAWCGYCPPFMIFAGIVMPIAAGLITTWTPDTSLAAMICYTALSGLGYGVGALGPSTAVQTVLPETDIPLGMSALMFSSAFGPAIMIAIAQVIFTSQLSSNLHDLIPGLGDRTIDSNGLTELVKLVPPAKVGDVLLGINDSVMYTYYLVIALAIASFFASLPVEWINLKEIDTNSDQEADSDSRLS